jgi:hypothetical protein
MESDMGESAWRVELPTCAGSWCLLWPANGANLAIVDAGAGISARVPLIRSQNPRLSQRPCVFDCAAITVPIVTSWLTHCWWVPAC